ncbi:HlyD family type I secretion periplasmic adaptor subunit [Sphingomonas sp.]|uniref:HlyD family type I secretion periplasmic adaptor subunit n=1 Tax=Sphingomonas sp. TaxID=28214 RepID=UPI000DB53FF0|nr:HlyD family type I secretion periplasmic adaptor subunit [Sphingomonas sp.]PZU08494.1 MAG: HlyD family type I secretion periplasmic adaptor subunit [Sphingomonas sp.]
MSTAPHSLEDLAIRFHPSQASRILLWSIVGFFVVALGWATFTRLDRTVHGVGRVVPTAQLQVVSNLEGGVVEKILVKAGDRVKAMQPLIRLDRTATGAEFGSGEAAVQALTAKVARLEGEVGGHPPLFPADAAEAVGIEEALYRSRQADLASLSAAGEARIAQAQRAVAEAEATLASKSAARDAARSEADLIRPLVLRGIEPRLSLVQAENQLAITAADANAAAAALARARAGVAEARATLTQTRQDWRAKAAEDLASARADLAARRRQLPALSDKMRRTEVRAPLAGRVNRVMVATVGGSVRPGDPLVEIVPEDGALTVEVQVRPEDIAFVAVGQPARVKISAYDYAIYGAIDGRVVNISPDAVANEKTGEIHYEVRVQTHGQLTDADGRPLPIGPGMVSDVSLIGDKRSVLSYVLTPITRLRENAFQER